ncbi:unnamed protein product [Adineta ricciae]|uniref:Uncharacterized protein n=1 Tax=Adineta ricciae TaxID=249248 RepID=A0A815Y765_ADIRI|nr:unnamed protein product [Adineta ricciae]
MVYNALDIAHQFIQKSLPKPRSESSSPKQYLITNSFQSSRFIPLMARPFEVINITGETTDNTKDDGKPPEQHPD